MTDLLICGFIVAIAATDVALLWSRQLTYSERFKELGGKVSFFPYAWGVFGGHFWAPVEAAHLLWWQVLVALIGLGLVITLLHLAVRRLALRCAPWLGVLLYFPIGVAIGALLWGQGG